jgi:hypothetical protein
MHSHGAFYFSVAAAGRSPPGRGLGSSYGAVVVGAYSFPVLGSDHNAGGYKMVMRLKFLSNKYFSIGSVSNSKDADINNLCCYG